jgi:hypothetical protein
MSVDSLTTLDDDQDRRYLLLEVAIDQDQSVPRLPTEFRWHAYVCDPASPLAGLEAFGATLGAAGDGVARRAWAAVVGGELVGYGVTATVLNGIHVIAKSCLVYDGEALTDPRGVDPKYVRPAPYAQATAVPFAAPVGQSKPYRSWVRQAACAGKSDVFEQPDRTADALGICGRCPVLGDCRQWALEHAVAGVAGGLTAAAREGWRQARGVPEPIVELDDFLTPDVNLDDFGNRAIRRPSVLRAVAQWTEEGESARQIASRLACSSRRVQRLRTAGRRLQG